MVKSLATSVFMLFCWEPESRFTKAVLYQLKLQRRHQNQGTSLHSGVTGVMLDAWDDALTPV